MENINIFEYLALEAFHFWQQIFKDLRRLLTPFGQQAADNGQLNVHCQWLTPHDCALDDSNERSDFALSDERIRLRAKQYADRKMENLNYHAMVGANKILRCPVCEEINLVRYNDGDGNDAEVKCMCCTFNVQHSLGNAKNCGIEIEDFWG